MIYDNVKALADKKGLSIGEVERRANLSNGTIGKWRINDPKISSVIAVSKVLNVSVKTLIAEK